MVLIIRLICIDVAARPGPNIDVSQAGRAHDRDAGGVVEWLAPLWLALEPRADLPMGDYLIN